MKPIRFVVVASEGVSVVRLAELYGLSPRERDVILLEEGADDSKLFGIYDWTLIWLPVRFGYFNARECYKDHIVSVKEFSIRIKEMREAREFDKFCAQLKARE